MYYANAAGGNDSNNGTSWALAKKTLSGVDGVASAGDTVMVHGVFRETIPVSKQLFWIGFGRCQFNGNGGSGVAPSAGTSFDGIDFTGWSDAPFSSIASAILSFQCKDCTFHDIPNAIISGASDLPRNLFFERCQFFSLSSSGICFLRSYSDRSYFMSLCGCVFYGNALDLKVSGYQLGSLSNCVFGSPVMFSAADSSSPLSQDNNVFDFTNGKNIYNGTDKTSLSDWRTASSQDANSIDRVWRTDVGDYANNALRSNPSGYLLTAGSGGNPLGLYLPGLTVSNNTNSTYWTNGVGSGCAIDGPGNVYLTGTSPTSGTWATDVIDLGANIASKSIELIGSGENDPTTYFDADTGDSPNYRNLEVRLSATSFTKSAGSPSWITVPRGADLGAYTNNNLRYIQVRVTLRG